MQKLADETLNNESVVSSENAEHLLEVMRQATADELKEKHALELETKRAEAEQHRQQTKALIDELTSRLKGAEERERRSRKRIESHVASVVKKINSRLKLIEGAVIGSLCVLGVTAVINYFSNILDGYTVWTFILGTAGALGIVTLTFNILGRPMPGFVSVLNIYGRYAIRKRLSALGPVGEDVLDNIEVTDGRIKIDKPT